MIIGDRAQRDFVHARCSAYVERRLRGFGWQVAREVEIVQAHSHGWIDLLAFDDVSGTLLVIEIKTTIDDLGALERQVAWYERTALDEARRLGWRPRRVISWTLLLATASVETALRENRDIVNHSWPRRADVMLELATNPVAVWPGGRSLALIDPTSRRRRWLIRCQIDGRRSAAAYRDYADAARRLRSGRSLS